jgi:hypothetical protein
MPEEIPDSISFSLLRQLHTEKADRFDFSSPSVSPAMGDLSFLISMFLKTKVNQSYSHQVVFLLDVLVTELRVECDKMVTEMIDKQAPAEDIKLQGKILGSLSIMESMLDGMVSLYGRKLGQTSGKPSYQLIKSLDPSVLPHQLDDWLKTTMESLR